jgi:hypothetical protein
MQKKLRPQSAQTAFAGPILRQPPWHDNCVILYKPSESTEEAYDKHPDE